MNSRIFRDGIFQPNEKPTKSEKTQKVLSVARKLKSKCGVWATLISQVGR